MSITRAIVCPIVVICSAVIMWPGCDSVTARTGVGLIVGEGTVEVSYGGATATLTAAPHSGWRFDHWEGPNDYSTENPHSIGAQRVLYYAVVFVLEDDQAADDLPEPDVTTNGTDAEPDAATNGIAAE